MEKILTSLKWKDIYKYIKSKSGKYMVWHVTFSLPSDAWLASLGFFFLIIIPSKIKKHVLLTFTSVNLSFWRGFSYISVNDFNSYPKLYASNRDLENELRHIAQKQNVFLICSNLILLQFHLLFVEFIFFFKKNIILRYFTQRMEKGQLKWHNHMIQ